MAHAQDLQVRAGDRVVVRYRDDDDRLTDVLGVLVAADGDRLRIRPDRGPGAPETLVDRRRVVTAKPVPPRARRAEEVEGLERAMAEHWRAPETRWLGGTGGWLLRAAEGFTNRANSALVLGDPGVPRDEALRVVRDWYAERGLAPQLAVPAWEAPRHRWLREAGWTAKPGAGARVLVAGVDARRSPAFPAGDLSLEWAEAPGPEWLARYHYRGQDLAPVATRLLTSASAQAFGTVRGPDGHVVAVARVSAAAGWAGITAVEVAEDHRRRGIGTRLVAAAAAWASSRGVDRCFLQVGLGNEPARMLYLRAGFVEHHTYDYVTAPTD